MFTSMSVEKRFWNVK